MKSEIQMRRAQRACRQMAGILLEYDVPVKDCAVDEDGSVVARAEDITIRDVPAFCDALDGASSFEIWQAKPDVLEMKIGYGRACDGQG